jgi:hypothetical protein
MLQGKTGREHAEAAAHSPLQRPPEFKWNIENAGKEQPRSKTKLL